MEDLDASRRVSVGLNIGVSDDKLVRLVGSSVFNRIGEAFSSQDDDDFDIKVDNLYGARRTSPMMEVRMSGLSKILQIEDGGSRTIWKWLGDFDDKYMNIMVFIFVTLNITEQ